MGLDLIRSLLTTVETQDTISVPSLTLFVGLLCTCIIIGHLVEGARWINESIAAVAFGLVSGFLILWTSGWKSSHLLQFNGQIFFIYVLPPIIFNAGFQMRKKQFFRNFATISLYGVVGTLISFGTIAFGAKILFELLNIGSLKMGDYLAIGAIFSATDSVCTLQVLDQESAPLLYSLVFGEGVVNDATSVVLFNAILNSSDINLASAFHIFGNFVFLFTTSTLLGVSVGLLCAYVIRKLYFIRYSADRSKHSTDYEVALMILMAYLSYMMAEVFKLSGILTVFFCGIVMSHYTLHNVTVGSRTTAKHSFATMSYIAESFIFLYVGMDALDMEKWMDPRNSPEKTLGASAVLILLVLIGRALSVFPISFLSNFGKRNVDEKIHFKQQVTIWWAGLMRGAVSMALAYNKFTNSDDPQRPGNVIMVTSTITVVLFSTIVFGWLTKPIMRFLMRNDNTNSNLAEQQTTSNVSLTVPLLDHHHNLGRVRSIGMLLSQPTCTIHYYWKKFDDSVMRPIFGGPGLAPYTDVGSVDSIIRLNSIV